MAERLSVRQLAAKFNLSAQRIYDKVKDGTLTLGDDHKIDVNQALAWRQKAVLTHPIQTLANPVSNGYFSEPPKGLTAPPSAAVLTDDDFDRDLYDGNPPPAPAPSAPVHPRTATEGLVDNASEVVRLRAVKLQADIDRVRQRSQIEAGLLIEKAKVRDQGFEAGKVIKSLLEALPTEIAGIFVEPERRAEVRAKVQERVDQMIYALHAAIAASAGDVGQS